MTDLTHRGQTLLQDLDGFSIEVDEKRERADIILRRPPLNVISMHARDQLRAAFEALDEDDRVRVIVVRANGEHFSSGGDIKGFLEASPEHVSKLAWNIAAPARCTKPVIAANRGFCFGVGFELSLACDFRIATDTTFYALPEQKLGQIPGSGGSAKGNLCFASKARIWMSPNRSCPVTCASTVEFRPGGRATNCRITPWPTLIPSSQDCPGETR